MNVQARGLIFAFAAASIAGQGADSKPGVKRIYRGVAEDAEKTKSGEEGTTKHTNGRK